MLKEVVQCRRPPIKISTRNVENRIKVAFFHEMNNS